MHNKENSDKIKESSENNQVSIYKVSFECENMPIYAQFKPICNI